MFDWILIFSNLYLGDIIIYDDKEDSLYSLEIKTMQLSTTLQLDVGNIDGMDFGEFTYTVLGNGILISYTLA